MDETDHHRLTDACSGQSTAVSESARSIAVLITGGTLAVAAVFITTAMRSVIIPVRAAAQNVPQLPPPDPAVVEDVAGYSVLGRPVPRLCIGAGPAVLVMASIHGNESAGTSLVEQLGKFLLESSDEVCSDRSIVLMPVVNPDGVENQTRGNANGVDLNRNFPAENRENSRRYGMTALSEPEALAIYQTIEQYQPVRIITLHEPLDCVDYDGPGLAIASAMADVSPLSVKKLGTRPGSMGAFTGESRKIPTITLELPRNAKRQSAAELWELYGRAMKVAVTFPLRPENTPNPVDGTASELP